MKLFKFTAYSSTYFVHTTIHLHEKRKGSTTSRLSQFTPSKIKGILYYAAQYISEFRNKGRFTITFKTTSGRTGALLCALEGNRLTIITALYNVKRYVNDVFHGVPHCYLPTFIFSPPTREENEKHLQNLQYNKL